MSYSRSLTWGKGQLSSPIPRTISSHRYTGQLIAFYLAQRSPLSSGFWIRLVKYQINRKNYSRAELRNQEQSPLVGLPVEIMLEFLGYTDMVSKLCIRRVCARLRDSFPIIEQKAIDEWPKTIPRSPDYLLDHNDKVQYILMLRRDKRCQLRIKYRKQLHQKPKHRESDCSGCLTIHSSSAFHPHELSTPPTSRTCSGLGGRVTFFDHISFSSQCLFNALRDFRYLTIRATPNEFDATDGWDFGKLPLPKDMTPPLQLHNNKVSIDNVHVLLRRVKDTPLTHAMLSSSLDTLNAKICPHLTTRSPHLFGGEELSADCTLEPYVQARFNRQNEFPHHVKNDTNRWASV